MLASSFMHYTDVSCTSCYFKLDKKVGVLYFGMLICIFIYDESLQLL